MIEVRQIGEGGNLSDFLNVVDSIYAGDPQYIRPLDMFVKDQLNTKKNPFFEHGEAAFFTAHRHGECVGRISASIDREHLDRYKDDTGFFGFLDTIDDPDVARALIDKAESWLKARGIKRARGPFSLSINEESGCLVKGFDTPPVFLCSHHRPYQGGLIEQAGYAKAKDLFGWKYMVSDMTPRVKRGHDEIRALPEVTSRMGSLKDIERDVGIFVDVFNDAWSDNWGFVPFTRNEVRKMAADFKLILQPEITRIVSIDGEPAAVAVTLPNLNEMIPDLRGSLFPFGWAKLLYRLKVQGPRSARLIILGVRRKYRNVRKYAGLSAFLYGELALSGKRIGIEWGELGWTLEDNGAVNAGIKVMGGKNYKTYRIYEKSLGT
ncbi:hypothetical protein LVJ94_52390 [Pendulispora rubella]|uniref:N-acetyltransferase domain-containing protein n=1 Tax=Pendulispora rubella TaxID=2741070 RepID=A0ABZ2L561_9BACT